MATLPRVPTHDPSEYHPDRLRRVLPKPSTRPSFNANVVPDTTASDDLSTPGPPRVPFPQSKKVVPLPTESGPRHKELRHHT